MKRKSKFITKVKDISIDFLHMFFPVIIIVFNLLSFERFIGMIATIALIIYIANSTHPLMRLARMMYLTTTRRAMPRESNQYEVIRKRK